MIQPIEWASLEGRVEEMFAPGGLLSRAKNYEHRPQQQRMSAEVARCLEEKRHLIVEAGTGVGKSLAYLIPAVHFAVEKGRKALISTNTINLQEQLLYKDIPIVKKLLPFNFEAALLKGRQNYICPQRLERAMRGKEDLFIQNQYKELDRIWAWFEKTKDGTLSDMDVQPDLDVWSQVCSEEHACTSKTCGQDPKCFYQQARKRLLDANVIILNHTLFFTWLGGMEVNDEGYLFHNDFLIFDEAHALERVAARHIGIEISSGSLRYLLHRLYNPATHKGLLQLLRLAKAQKLVTNALDEAEQFFLNVESACGLTRRNETRVRHPEIVEDTLSLPLMKVRETLLEAVPGVKDESTKDELRDTAGRIAETQSGLSDFLQQKREDYVYWAERAGKRKPIYRLQASPIDLAPELRKIIFQPEKISVMTSATLSVGQGLNYFQTCIGGESAECLQLDSPFDYGRQMKVYIPSQMPDPQAKGYEEGLARWIPYFVEKTGGRALVLFTSYALMNRMEQKLSGWFAKQGVTLLVQGSGLPRSVLLEKFKKDVDSVLFGTESFWQGVDVPGEALSNVIVTKLPFAVPDHPLIEAKFEKIKAEGGDAFREYSLPEAILRFRQGVGRLIRAGSDEGIVAILDKRVLSKPYGKSFLAKLPECEVEVLREEE